VVNACGYGGDHRRITWIGKLLPGLSGTRLRGLHGSVSLNREFGCQPTPDADLLGSLHNALPSDHASILIILAHYIGEMVEDLDYTFGSATLTSKTVRGARGLL